MTQSLLTNNGSDLTSCSFQAHLFIFIQTICFAGMGAHHKNGPFKLSWSLLGPRYSTPPYTGLMLQIPSFGIWLCSQALSPYDIFTQSCYPLSKFYNMHMFGCPVYVIGKTIVMARRFHGGWWQSFSISFVNAGLSLMPHPLPSSLTLLLVPSLPIVSIAASSDKLPNFNSD
jgi:hypothetical protein